MNLNNIETIILLLLLFMVVPDFCDKIKRPALVFPLFAIFGILVAPFVGGDVISMIKEAGKIGFLLLLFEVGIEVDMPSFRKFLKPLLKASLWMLLQFPLVMIIAHYVGLNWREAILAAAAITGCSVGMAHIGWKNYKGFSEEQHKLILYVMIALEVLCVLFLSVQVIVLEKGSAWTLSLKLSGIIATIFFINYFSVSLRNIFERILTTATHWRTHLVILLVLATCMVGEWVGLPADMTAFFLGLSMSRTKHQGMPIEVFTAPISQRFLIPLFFVALGFNIPWEILWGMNSLYALGTALLLLVARKFLYKYLFPVENPDSKAFFLLCPNLTLVALASSFILIHEGSKESIMWLVLTGLFMTVPAILFLPKGKIEEAFITKQKPEQTSNKTKEALVVTEQNQETSI